MTDVRTEAVEPKTAEEITAAELHLMKTAGIIEVAIRNPNVNEYMHHWERRAEKAEAQLTAAKSERDDAEARAARLAASLALASEGNAALIADGAAADVDADAAGYARGLRDAVVRLTTYGEHQAISCILALIPAEPCDTKQAITCPDCKGTGFGPRTPIYSGGFQVSFTSNRCKSCDTKSPENAAQSRDDQHHD